MTPPLVDSWLRVGLSVAVLGLIAAGLLAVTDRREAAQRVDTTGYSRNVHIDWRGPWPTTTTSTTVATVAEPGPEPQVQQVAAPQHDQEDELPPLGQGVGGVSDAELASIRACESGGDYAYDDGLYTGAYNYLDSTWRRAGGSTAQAKDASPAEQDAVTRSYIASGHRGAWPNC